MNIETGDFFNAPALIFFKYIKRRQGNRKWGTQNVLRIELFMPEIQMNAIPGSNEKNYNKYNAKCMTLSKLILKN